MYLSDYELQLAQRRYAELVREVEVDRLARAAKLQPNSNQPARSRLARLWFFLVVNRLARA
jgi:hypothetical protein